jgi:hypothetical protein
MSFESIQGRIASLAARLKSRLSNHLMAKFKIQSKYKWLVILALLAIADYYFISVYILMISSSDDKMKTISTLFTFNSIILAGIGIMYQVQSTQEREIRFRIHEQRREFYNQFLKYLANFFAAIKEKGSDVSPTEIISNNSDYFNLHYKMAIYASPNVIKAYSEIMREGMDHSDDPMWAMSKLASIFMDIRKEVGFTEGDIAVRRILSLWINDINEFKYDELFKKLK